MNPAPDFTLLQGGAATLEAPPAPTKRKLPPERASLKMLAIMRARVQAERDAATDMELHVLENLQKKAVAQRAETAQLTQTACAHAVDLTHALHATDGEFDRARAFCALEQLNHALYGLVEKLGLLAIALLLTLAATLANTTPAELELRRPTMHRIRTTRRETETT